MVGRQHGITPLIGLTEKVLQTGIGRDKGARQQDIDYWVKELGLVVDQVLGPAKDSKFLTTHLAQGRPVIVSLQLGAEAHAVLLLRISPKKEQWTADSGAKVDDYAVTFVDPNHHRHDNTTSWTWFSQRWGGRAYAFDVAKQPRHLLQPPRVLLADFVGPPAPVHPAGPVGPVPSLQGYALGKPQVTPVPLVDQHGRPVYNPFPDPAELTKKDGVQRPLDVILYSAPPVRYVMPQQPQPTK
jgi:hypothetical protein